MEYSFRMRDCHIVGNKVVVHPSKWGGTGEIEVSGLDMVWTGSLHLLVPKVAFQSAEVDSVQTRNNLDESDEPWKLLWKRTGKWSYAGDHELEAVLTKVGGVGL